MYTISLLYDLHINDKRDSNKTSLTYVIYNIFYKEYGRISHNIY
jgi:hypothetical protein